MSKSESQEFSQDDDHDESGVNKAYNISKVKKDPEKSGEMIGCAANLIVIIITIISKPALTYLIV